MPYRAEQFVPHVDPAASNVTMLWQWGTFNSDMRAAVDDAVRNDIVRALRDIARRQADANVRAALFDFADHLNRDGIRAIEAAIGVRANP